MCSILKIELYFQSYYFWIFFVLLKLLSNQSIKSLVYVIAQMLITKLYEHVLVKLKTNQTCQKNCTNLIVYIYKLFRTRTITM